MIIKNNKLFKTKKMKKVVKPQDIKAIIRKYYLSEDEAYELDNICFDINAEKDMAMYSTSLSFYLSPYYTFNENKDRYNAIAALLHYFGTKIQKEVGPFFKETCQTLAMTLNTAPRLIERMFRGMFLDNIRWSHQMYLADRCGLNTLELYK